MATTEVPASNTDEGKPWHLSGNNAPVFDELTVTELEVKGTIPSESVSYTHLRAHET